MVLDSDKARTYDCQTCDYNLQLKRNCSNHYAESKLVLNDRLYTQCPRSLLFNEKELRLLVDLYFECKDMKCWPYPGTILHQTAYTSELFDFIDNIVNTYRNKKLKEQEAQLKKSQNEAKKKTK